MYSLKKVMRKLYSDSKELKRDTRELSLKGARYSVSTTCDKIEVVVRCRECSYVYLTCKRMGFLWCY